MSDAIWKARRDVIHTAAAAGGVLLDLARKTYFALNGSGDALWKKLEAGASRAELIDEVLAQYEIDKETAARDVDTLLSALESARLVVRAEGDGAR